MDAYREGGEREKERERVRACTRASLRSHSSTNVELNYSASSLLHAAPVTHPRPASRNRWWTMGFFPPPFLSTPSSPREYPVLGSQRDRKGNRGKGCSVGRWRSSLYSAREEKDARRPEGVRPGYEFTDSVERGLLFARGCGGFRQKPHAYLSLSLCPRLSTQPPPLLLPLGCVMEIAFARRGEEGRAWPVLQSNGGSARNYYWANCILTNSKGVRV